jgi:hypothetical protein
MSISLQFLWSYLNTIQILSVLPLLQLNMPPFMVIFFSNINKFNLLFVDLGDQINADLDLRPESQAVRN